jgi:hypothetical protein
MHIFNSGGRQTSRRRPLQIPTRPEATVARPEATQVHPGYPQVGHLRRSRADQALLHPGTGKTHSISRSAKFEHSALPPPRKKYYNIASVRLIRICYLAFSLPSLTGLSVRLTSVC